MLITKNKELLPRARALRREMTPWERRLWYTFLRNYPVKIYKQKIIESFIVDFYCDAAKLVIELDGSQHYDPEHMAYDAARTAVIERYGLLVLRFSNKDIDQQFDAVCRHIDRVIRQRMGDAAQTPLSQPDG